MFDDDSFTLQIFCSHVFPQNTRFPISPPTFLQDEGNSETRALPQKLIPKLVEWGDGGLVASGRAYQLMVLSSIPGTCWPFFFTNAAKWPKIIHMLLLVL